MRLVIFIRTNIKWAEMDIDAFMAQPPRGQPDPWIAQIQKRRIIQGWGDTFDVNYFKFRSTLQQLSEANLDQIETEVIRGPEELEQELDNPEPCFFLPTDDDDWINPNILDVQPNTPVFSWQLGRIKRDGKFETDNRPSLTNNTLIDKTFVIENELQDLLLDHYNMQQYLHGHDDDVTTIPNCLSMSNKHIASLTALMGLRTRRMMLQWTTLHCINYNLPAEFQWAKQYVRDSAYIHRSLLHSAKNRPLA